MIRGATQDVALPVRLSGRRVRLTCVTPELYEFLYELIVSEDTVHRGRLRGIIPPFETFVDQLWDDIASQFVVVRRMDDIPIGLVTLERVNMRNRTASLGLVLEPASVSSGLGVEAAALFLDYAWACFDLYKIYLDVPEFNLPAFESGLDHWLVEEGRLREHIYYRGRRWDELILAIYPERVAAFAALADPEASDASR